MSEEEKPTEITEAVPVVPVAASGEEPKEEESTAHFEPVVSNGPPRGWRPCNLNAGHVCGYSLEQYYLTSLYLLSHSLRSNWKRSKRNPERKRKR
jgi:hypothetical protein